MSLDKAKVADAFRTMDYGPAPEADKPARDWLAGKNGAFGHFIGGEWTGPAESRFDAVNPARSEVLASLSQGSAEDIDNAVKAARKAFAGWRDTSGHGRARVLYALARLIQRHSRLLSVLESLDNGKPIRETRDIDIPLAARHFYHHAGWAQMRDGQFPGHEPHGVVGQIIPWNFPFLMLAWKIAPALAAGNTVVLKPAEYTSLTALLFADLCIEAGVPKGVVNIVTGDGRTGSALVGHPDVDKLAFTGSTEVGRIIRTASAGTGKALTLELGGKSPFIVFDDADLDAAVEGVVDAIWFNQGQVCCAGSRLLIQEDIEERFIDKLKARMDTLRLGDPLDKAIDMGAIVAPAQLTTIMEMVSQGAEEGAHVHQASCPMPKEGLFYPPTLITGVSPASVVVREEIFGPVITAMSFRTPTEAAELANNTKYGLAASLWTENVNLALDIAPKIKAGVVWVNSTNLFDAACGFGGYRESGYGREGGREGMFAYLKSSAGAKAGPYKDPEPVAPERLDGGLASIDRTAKNYVGGKQARPDSGYSMPVTDPKGRLVGEVGLGNRKDIRNAVEAAHKAAGWGKATAHNRAQVLYYLGENLSIRANEFRDRLRTTTGVTEKQAAREVETAIERIFLYAAWADKYDGAVHSPPMRSVAIAMNEPVGVIGIACPSEAPLLGFVSLVLPAIALGNTVVAVPSQTMPLSATDFYQVLETSDVPGGVLNIVTGPRDELAHVLADHDDVDAVWYVGPKEGGAMVEKASVGNLKQTWTNSGRAIDWYDAAQAEGEAFLRRASQVKNIWVPYGE